MFSALILFSVAQGRNSNELEHELLPFGERYQCLMNPGYQLMTAGMSFGDVVEQGYRIYIDEVANPKAHTLVYDMRLFRGRVRLKTQSDCLALLRLRTDCAYSRWFHDGPMVEITHPGIDDTTNGWECRLSDWKWRRAGLLQPSIHAVKNGWIVRRNLVIFHLFDRTPYEQAIPCSVTERVGTDGSYKVLKKRPLKRASLAEVYWRYDTEGE